ncbi:hypothetical protein IGI04_015443 [Brassica rapa subsp. trilocularis]|uniref:Uncharacterized protein n=1 Tax=Brassica rapa subsp. trilocularis TaxID=1813537 RepID=A0ABQ7MT20_BRACM|nr:hypothetical protein IGI04_015443 [Brassica rapa subsp. trilocularis]
MARFNEVTNRTDEATAKSYEAAARSDEATARSAETTVRSDEATARSDKATVKSDYFAKALKSGKSTVKATVKSDYFAKAPMGEDVQRVPLSHIPLIPLLSFEILVFLTFLFTSTRVKVSIYREGETIYPLLRDVALSPDMPGGSNAMKQMFTFALRSARKVLLQEIMF